MAARRLLIGLVLLWVPGALRADKAQDQAVQVVEKLGGKITRDARAPGEPVIAVDLRDAPVTDAKLKELAPLTPLQSLDLGFTPVTDAGLKELAPLTHLQSLHLTRTQLTDAGLKELASLTHLHFLDLWG